MPNATPQHYYSLARDRWMFAGGPGILMYHKVARPPLTARNRALYADPSSFARQMRELATSGLTCLSFGDVAAAAAGEVAGFCLTFDDGFRNVGESALPILQQYGLRSTQFIVAGLIGGQDAWDHASGEPPQKLMDEQEIRSWIAAGQEIGAHTLTHPRLTTLPASKARAEIFDSKKVLEDRFGLPIRHFCYPYGDCNEQVRDWVGEAGYEAAASVDPGVNGPQRDPLRLRRFLAGTKRSKLSAVPGKMIRAWRKYRPR